MMARDTSILIKPVFGKTPETFNSIKMITPLGLAFLFGNYYMITSYGQRTVGVPIISIVKATGLYMLVNYFQEIFSASGRNRESKNLAISLIHTKYHMFSRRSPASFAGTPPSKHSLVHFYFSGDIRLFKLNKSLVIDCLSCHCKNLLNSLKGAFYIFSHPVCWYSQSEKVKYVSNLIYRYLKLIQISGCEVAELIITVFTLKTVVLKFPENGIFTSRTMALFCPT